MAFTPKTEFDYFLEKAGNTIVIDTNVFLLFIVGSSDRRLIKKIGHVNHYNERDFNTLINVLKRFKKFVVTPNILTEISNLIGGEKHPHKEKIFKQMLIILSNDNFEETFIESPVILKDNSVYHFGVTDVGIANLKTNHDHYGVITADDPLYKELNKRGIPTLNFEHLKSSS